MAYFRIGSGGSLSGGGLVDICNGQGGYVTSVPLANRLLNYEQATISDFVVEITAIYWTANQIGTDKAPLITKSYNASTGILSVSVSGGSIGEIVVYKPNLTIGTSTTGSINVTSKVTNYASCTVNDFVVEASSIHWDGNSLQQTSCPLIIKSYNKSTGVLSFRGGTTLSNSAGTSYFTIKGATIYYIGDQRIHI